MGYYINFVFRELCYDDEEIIGVFDARDCDVWCRFSYDRNTNECEIWENNKPREEIEPLPIRFLTRKLEETGTLNEQESRICY